MKYVKNQNNDCENCQNRPVYIYALKDPRSGDVRYVGKTVNCKLRFRGHIRDCVCGKTHKDIWIRELVNNDLLPEMCVIEVSDERHWQEREIFYIDLCRKQYNLTNVSDGGDSPPRWAMYYWKGKKRSPESVIKSATTFKSKGYTLAPIKRAAMYVAARVNNIIRTQESRFTASIKNLKITPSISNDIRSYFNTHYRVGNRSNKMQLYDELAKKYDVCSLTIKKCIHGENKTLEYLTTGKIMPTKEKYSKIVSPEEVNMIRAYYSWFRVGLGQLYKITKGRYTHAALRDVLYSKKYDHIPQFLPLMSLTFQNPVYENELGQHTDETGKVYYTPSCVKP